MAAAESSEVDMQVYDGFISYSHAADDLLAPRLQAGLQRFAKPWWQRRAMRVFRDESSLSANPHLWSSITDALDSSGWFVLLLSPDAAESEWVNQEVAYWVEHRDPSRILPVLTDGEFGWAEGDVTGDAVPDALRGVFEDEPRWVDLRFAKGEEQLDLQDPRFADAVADIASAMRGVAKDELASEEVRQHRRTVRTAWGAGSLVLLLGVASSVAALFALEQAEIASAAQAEAEASAAAEAEASEQALESEAEARADRDAALAAAADSRRSELEALAVASDQPFVSVLLSLEAARFGKLSVSGQTRLTGSLLADRVVARWSLPHLEARVAGLHPSGKVLALSDVGSGPGDTSTLSVVTPDGEEVWSYELGPAGVAAHDPYFSAGGSELAAAVAFQPFNVEGVEMEDRPADLVEGVYVWSAVQAGEPEVYPFPCQAPVEAHPVVRVELNPDARHLPATEAPLVVWYEVAGDGSCDTTMLAAYRFTRATGGFEPIDRWPTNDWNRQSSISSDGRWLLSMARLVLVDLETGSEFPVPNQAQLDPAGELLITPSGLFTLPGLEPVEAFRPSTRTFGPTSSPVFGPNGDLYVSDDESLSRLDLATGEELDRLATGTGTIVDFISSDGRYVLFRSGLGSTSGEEVLLADLGRATSPAFTAIDLGPGTYWWDGLHSSEGVVVATRTGPDEVGDVVAFADDGTKLYEGQGTGPPRVAPDGGSIAHQPVDDGVVGAPVVVDLATGDAKALSGVCPYPIPDGPFPAAQEWLDSLDQDCPAGSIEGLWVWDIVFSPDGSLLAASDRGPVRALHIWDVASGDLLHSEVGWADEQNAVDAIAFHPTGEFVYVTHRSRITTLEMGSWKTSDLESGNRWTRAVAFEGDRVVCAWNFSICESPTVGGQFSYDENSLGSFNWGFLVEPELGVAVLSAQNGRVGVWELDGLERVAEVATPQEIGITGVALTEVGDLLFTPRPGPVLRMPLDQDRLLSAAAAGLTRGFTPAECEEFGIEDCLTSANGWRELFGRDG